MPMSITSLPSPASTVIGILAAVAATRITSSPSRPWTETELTSFSGALQRVPLTSTCKSLPSGSSRTSIWSFVGPDWSPSMTSSAGRGRGGAAMPVKERSSIVKSLPGAGSVQVDDLDRGHVAGAGIPGPENCDHCPFGLGTVKAEPICTSLTKKASVAGRGRRGSRSGPAPWRRPSPRRHNLCRSTR